MNTVSLQQTIHKVSITGLTHTVSPQVLDHTVTIDNTQETVTVAIPQVTLQVTPINPTVNVQNTQTRVVSAAIQGPQGPSGAGGSGDEIAVLNKAERKDIVEDSPSPGDITRYYGIAAPQSDENAAVWLITREIFTADGDLFDTSKTFASTAEDQIWTNRLGLTYT